MRLYSLRSIVFLGLALIASATFLALPARADVFHASPHVYAIHDHHADIAKALHDLDVAMLRHEAQRDAAFFLNSDPVPTIGGAGNQRTPFDLKPEYAASYATDGLSFIDLRWRC